MNHRNDHELAFGSDDLQLPEPLREPLVAHLNELRQKYLKRGWGGRVGFGQRPALVVIDLAFFWTRPENQIGCNADAIVTNVGSVLDAARKAAIPIFFTTFAYDPSDPPCPHDLKLQLRLEPEDERLFEIDPRLEQRSTEKLIRKRYPSCFKGTNFHEMLTALNVDTLIVTGMSTSHCVYATCRDAIGSFRVIVPEEAVGERCEIMHRVNLLDIDIDLGDVTSVDETIRYLGALSAKAGCSDIGKQD